jgi:hypothetical protein
MKKLVLPVTLLTFAAACGDPSSPTGVNPVVATAPSGGPSFHSGSGNGSGSHIDLQPASITAPAAGQVIELTTVGGTVPVTISWTAPTSVTSVDTRTSYEVILKVACSTNASGCTVVGYAVDRNDTSWSPGNLAQGTYTVSIRGMGTTRESVNGKNHASEALTRTFTVADPSGPPPLPSNAITFDLTGDAFDATYDPDLAAVNSQTYGAHKIDITKYAQATTGFPITYSILTPTGQDATCRIVDGSWVDILHAGDCVIQAAQNGTDGNGATKAQAATAVTQTIAIARKPLTLTAVATPSTKVYDAAAFPVATFRVTSPDWAYSDTDATNNLGGAIAFAVTNAAANTNTYPGAGSYVLTPSGLTSTDYSVSFAAGALQIDRKPLAITPVASPNTKVYDGSGFPASAFSVTYGPLAGTETAAALTGTIAFGQTNATGNTNTYPGAGAYALTATGQSSPNYDISYGTGPLTINQAPATIDLGSLAQPFAANTVRSVTVATTPAGLTAAVAYSQNGMTATPIAVGVYKVTATITDPNYVGSETGYLAIYDPSAGFVTGGGWIRYSASACRLSACLGTTGTYTADFGFVSKYQKGATVPTGTTRFEFHAGALNFASTSYEWLVVSGSRAQFKGVGTINGRGNYGFLLTAVDGTTDSFRMKIWDRDAGGDEDNTVFDNGGETLLNKITGNGSIVIHSR